MSSRIRNDDLDPGSGAAAAESREPEERREPQEPAPEQREPDPPANDRTPPPANDAEGEPSGELQEPDPRSTEARIRRLTREKYEAEQRAREAEQRFRQSQASQRPQPGNESEERAYQRFQQQHAEYDFAQRCNGLWEKGIGDYGSSEMQEAKAALDAVGWGNTPDALFTLTELPDGHRIYRELASDLDNAARILRLPHDQRTIALTRMSRDGNATVAATQAEQLRNLPPPVSRAPEPHRPVGGTAARRELSLDDPKLSMAEFIRRRDREARRSKIAL
jgi:hypothetical protein